MRRFWRAIFERGDAIERIFPEVAKTGINRCPAPGFQLVKSKRVEIGQGGKHLLRPHPRRGEGLMSVAEHRVGELDAFH